MDLIRIGKEARKTGFKARSGLRRDEHDMEDIDEFFDEGTQELTFSEFSKETSTERSGRLAFRDGSSLFSTKQFSHEREDETSASSAKRGMRNTGDQYHLSDSSMSVGPSDDNNEAQYEDFYLDVDDEELGVHHDGDLNTALQKGDQLHPRLTSKMALNRNTSTKQLLNLGSRAAIQPLGAKLDESINSPRVESRQGESRRTDEPIESSDALVHSSPKYEKSEDHLNVIGRYETKKDFLEKDSEADTSGDETFTMTEFDHQQEKLNQLSLLPSPPPDARNLRRSRRTKVKPLEYWRNERIIYTRAEDESLYDKDSTLVNDLKKVPLQEITRIIHVEEQDKKPKRRKATKKAKSTIPEASTKDHEIDGIIPQWLSEGAKKIEIFVDNENTAFQEVAWGLEGVTFHSTEEDGENPEQFVAAPLFKSASGSFSCGLIQLPLNGFKSLRSSNNLTCIFHVSEGRIEVNLNHNRFVVLQGCSFVVPISNAYGLRNVGLKIARLFFVQCRDLSMK